MAPCLCSGRACAWLVLQYAGHPFEFKADKLKSEYLGPLGFYMNAVDFQVKGEHDNVTIGFPKRIGRSLRLSIF